MLRRSIESKVADVLSRLCVSLFVFLAVLLQTPTFASGFTATASTSTPLAYTGGRITLTVSETGGMQPITYLWYNGTSNLAIDNPNATLPTFSFIANKTGNFTYYAVATDSSNPVKQAVSNTVSVEVLNSASTSTSTTTSTPTTASGSGGGSGKVTVAPVTTVPLTTTIAPIQQAAPTPLFSGLGLLLIVLAVIALMAVALLYNKYFRKKGKKKQTR